MMHKTSVYLTDDDQERLEYLARREGKSQAEILREALRQYENHPRDRRPWPSLDGSGEGDGRSVADIPEDELLRGFGEDSMGEPQGLRRDA